VIFLFAQFMPAMRGDHRMLFAFSAVALAATPMVGALIAMYRWW
jgi:hypothetical protein